MKTKTKIFTYILCITLLVTMFSFAPGIFAAEEDEAGQAEYSQQAAYKGQEQLQTPALYTIKTPAPADDTGESGETEAPTEPSEPAPACFNIKVTQTSGGTVSVSRASATAEEDVTVTVKPNKGYGVAYLKVNDKSVGATYSYTFKPTKNTTVAASFRKSVGYVFIMLDAGHYGKYNKSPVLKSYYESKMTWSLHLYLKQELEEYKNVVVDTTRSAQSRDLGVYYRGTASKGYNLLLSLHSNASGSKSADYPLIITQKNNAKDLLAISLGQTIESLMKTKQGYKTMQRLNRDKKTEYYGVLRGAKAVGTKGMIIEHSFHTNLNAAKWLSSSANLRRMAEAEAADLAAYYGLTKAGSDIIKPAKPSISVSNSGYNALTLKWKKSIGTTGYEVYRKTGKSGKYKKIKTLKGTTLSFKNSKLTAGKNYYYRVRPYRVSGKTKRYGSYSKAKGKTVRPSTPSVSSKAGRRKVTVRWKKVSGASRYAVYRATKKNGRYKRIATLKNNKRSYTNTRLKKKKTYYYKVRAYRIVKGKHVYSYYSKYTSKKAK